MIKDSKCPQKVFYYERPGLPKETSELFWTITLKLFTRMIKKIYLQVCSKTTFSRYLYLFPSILRGSKLFNFVFEQLASSIGGVLDEEKLVQTLNLLSRHFYRTFISSMKNISAHDIYLLHFLFSHFFISFRSHRE